MIVDANKVTAKKLGNDRLLKIFFDPSCGSENLTMGTVEWLPGSSGEVHVHDNYDEYFIVIEGSAEIQVGEEVYEVGPGSALFASKFTPHGVLKVKDSGLKMYFFLAPGQII